MPATQKLYQSTVLLGFLVSVLLSVPMLLSSSEQNKSNFDNPSTIRLLFVGDIMLDRTIRSAGERYGYDYIFKDIHEQLNNYDAVIGNLEGPVTKNDSVSVGSAVGTEDNTRFTFDLMVPEALKASNIRILNLGNNHILDYGIEGVDETKRHLLKNGLSFFGAPKEEEEVLYAEIEHVVVAFITYNQFLLESEWHVKKAMTMAHEHADIIVVYAHWGEEYAVEPSTLIKQKARRFVDAGADFVVGSHPHVIQPSEEYNGGYIYYSLGNFVFDQYWDASVRCGLALEVIIGSQKTIKTKEHTVNLKRDGRTMFEPCEGE